MKAIPHRRTAAPFVPDRVAALLTGAALFAAASSLSAQTAPPPVVDPPPVVVDPTPGVPPVTVPPSPPRVVRPAESPPVETGEAIEPAEVPPGVAITVTGRLEGKTESTISVTEGRTQKMWTFGVVPETEILLNGSRSKLEALEKDDAVRVTTNAADRSVAAKITAARAEALPIGRQQAPVRTAPQQPAPGRQPIAAYAGLGVYVADAPQGIYVVEVDPASPADGTVRHGDFILQMNNRQVTTPQVFLGWIQQQRPGETISLRLWRLGREFDQAITLADSSSAEDKVVEDPALNLILAQQVRTHSNLGLVLRETNGGLQVVQVEPGSPAAQFGLRVGSVIQTVNGQPATTAFDFYRSFWTTDPNGFVDLALADGIQRRIALNELAAMQQQQRLLQQGQQQPGQVPGQVQPGANVPPGSIVVPNPVTPKLPQTPGAVVPRGPGAGAQPQTPGAQPGQHAPGAQPGQSSPAAQPGQQAPAAGGQNPFRAGGGQP